MRQKTANRDIILTLMALIVGLVLILTDHSAKVGELIVVSVVMYWFGHRRGADNGENGGGGSGSRPRTQSDK